MRGAVAALALAWLSLSGCRGAPLTADQHLRVQPVAGGSVAAQERALADCHSRLGIAAPLMVQTLSAPGQPDRVVAVSANGLSQGAADRLNQCAATGQAPMANARDRAFADLDRVTPAPSLAYGCDIDTSILRGGVAYCPKGTY